jgi:hypothetical protein
MSGFVGLPSDILKTQTQGPPGIWDRVEMFFDALGMMRGRFAIVKRSILGFGLGTLIMWYWQPSFAFYRGIPRPWKAFGDNGDVPATWVPWWLALPVPLVLLFGLFI